jgi:hypothetical protein
MAIGLHLEETPEIHPARHVEPAVVLERPRLGQRLQSARGVDVPLRRLPQSAAEPPPIHFDPLRQATGSQIQAAHVRPPRLLWFYRYGLRYPTSFAVLSVWTTKLYDSAKDEITLDEVECISLGSAVA